MKIPPADEDKKEFLSYGNCLERLQEPGISYVSALSIVLTALNTSRIDKYRAMDLLTNWFHAEKTRWIELGFRMGKEEASKS